MRHAAGAREPRARRQGRKIELAIAWVPAKGEATPDPVFMLAGGPGQSALESFPSIAAAFAEVRKKRHVILVDQRGTGGSNKLVCKDAEGKSAVGRGRGLRRSARRAPSPRAAPPTLSKTADLRFYTHHRRDPGPGRGARRDRRAAAQPDGHFLRHARRAAVRQALPGAHAHGHHRRHRAEHAGARQRARAQPGELARQPVRALRRGQGLRRQARRPARAPQRADGEAQGAIRRW